MNIESPSESLFEEVRAFSNYRQSRIGIAIAVVYITIIDLIGLSYLLYISIRALQDDTGIGLLVIIFLIVIVVQIYIGYASYNLFSAKFDTADLLNIIAQQLQTIQSENDQTLKSFSANVNSLIQQLTPVKILDNTVSNPEVNKKIKDTNPILVCCPSCQATYRVQEQTLYKKAVCKKCGNEFIIKPFND